MFSFDARSRRSWDEDEDFTPTDDSRDEPSFRCPQCETNTGNGRLCAACREEGGDDTT